MSTPNLTHLSEAMEPAIEQVTKTLTPEDTGRLRPYFAAHRRLCQLITELEAVSIELAKRPAPPPAHPGQPGDQPA
jgi:hypothetical protein